MKFQDFGKWKEIEADPQKVASEIFRVIHFDFESMFLAERRRAVASKMVLLFGSTTRNNFSQIYKLVESYYK